MDKQKKQTTDHDRLVREWLKEHSSSARFTIPVKIGGIKKRPFYAGFSDDTLYLFEVFNDKHVEVLESHKWDDVETVMLSAGRKKARVILDHTVDLMFPKEGERVTHFLHKKEGLTVMEFKNNLWARLFG